MNTSSEQRVAGSEHRGPISQLPASISVRILRMHIRNDEALVAHYAGQLEGEDGVIDALPEQSAERARTLRSLGDTIRRLQRRRNALEGLSVVESPASRVESQKPTPISAT